MHPSSVAILGSWILTAALLAGTILKNTCWHDCATDQSTCDFGWAGVWHAPGGWLLPSEGRRTISVDKAHVQAIDTYVDAVLGRPESVLLDRTGQHTLGLEWVVEQCSSCPYRKHGHVWEGRHAQEELAEIDWDEEQRQRRLQRQRHMDDRRSRLEERGAMKENNTLFRAAEEVRAFCRAAETAAPFMQAPELENSGGPHQQGPEREDASLFGFDPRLEQRETARIVKTLFYRSRERQTSVCGHFNDLAAVAMEGDGDIMARRLAERGRPVGEVEEQDTYTRAGGVVRAYDELARGLIDGLTQRLLYEAGLSRHSMAKMDKAFGGENHSIHSDPAHRSWRDGSYGPQTAAQADELSRELLYLIRPSSPAHSPGWGQDQRPQNPLVDDPKTKMDQRKRGRGAVVQALYDIRGSVQVVCTDVIKGLVGPLRDEFVPEAHKMLASMRLALHRSEHRSVGDMVYDEVVMNRAISQAEDALRSIKDIVSLPWEPDCSSTVQGLYDAEKALESIGHEVMDGRAQAWVATCGREPPRRRAWWASLLPQPRVKLFLPPRATLGRAGREAAEKLSRCLYLAEFLAGWKNRWSES